MMQVSLIILLAGMSYSASPREIGDVWSRAARPIANAAEHRLHTRVQLKEQIEQWRTEAVQIKPEEAEQTLKEKPDVAELELMVGQDWEEVTRLLLTEIRSRANLWEKAYVGRRLVALLSLAPGDDLAEQERLLVRAFISAPNPIRALAEPRVEFPTPEIKEADKPGGPNPKAVGPSAAYLGGLGQAKEEFKNRSAQDERIMLVNQSMDVLNRDFAALLLKSGGRRAYLAVIEKLTLQLRDKDASFAQTVKALEESRTDEMGIRMAKVAQNKLNILAKRFGGPRQYTVYTEVKKQQLKRSDFGEIELDFQKIIDKTQSKLRQRIERHGRRRTFEPLEITPGPIKRTPGPTPRPGD